MYALKKRSKLQSRTKTNGLFPPDFSVFYEMKRKKMTVFKHLSLKTVILVEATGLEPTTFWSLTKRATKLRYASIYLCCQRFTA